VHTAKTLGFLPGIRNTAGERPSSLAVCTMPRRALGAALDACPGLGSLMNFRTHSLQWNPPWPHLRESQVLPGSLSLSLLAQVPMLSIGLDGTPSSVLASSSALTNVLVPFDTALFNATTLVPWNSSMWSEMHLSAVWSAAMMPRICLRSFTRTYPSKHNISIHRTHTLYTSTPTPIYFDDTLSNNHNQHTSPFSVEAGVARAGRRTRARRRQTDTDSHQHPNPQDINKS
jgi:hypothetical protein